MKDDSRISKAIEALSSIAEAHSNIAEAHLQLDVLLEYVADLKQDLREANKETDRLRYENVELRKKIEKPENL